MALSAADVAAWAAGHKGVGKNQKFPTLDGLARDTAQLV